MLSEEKCLKVKEEHGRDAAAKYILVVIPKKTTKMLGFKEDPAGFDSVLRKY